MHLFLVCFSQGVWFFKVHFGPFGKWPLTLSDIPQLTMGWESSQMTDKPHPRCPAALEQQRRPLWQRACQPPHQLAEIPSEGLRQVPRWHSQRRRVVPNGFIAFTSSFPPQLTSRRRGLSTATRRHVSFDERYSSPDGGLDHYEAGSSVAANSKRQASVFLLFLKMGLHSSSSLGLFQVPVVRVLMLNFFLRPSPALLGCKQVCRLPV